MKQRFHDMEQSTGRTAVGTAGSQAVDRAAALLDLIVTADQARTFTWLVEELGLARSTTSRLLQALERNRLVQRDRQGSFRPGALFALYAARHNAGNQLHDLAELAQPALDRLAQQTGETANFAVPRADGVVQVSQVDGRYLLGATNWVDIEVPPHCSALGKVFYAFGRLPLPEGPLEARTPSTIVNRAALDADLAVVRRRGWAAAVEELEVGLVAVAAPVRGPDGAVVGAVSVSGPTARIPADRLPGLGTLVAEQAMTVSTQLGFSRKVGAA
ncbi:MAG: IclR family transcriptional regulator [Kineosporiaceae bacterium]|nr:IclR family transcriptional regulator [Kineosporiaceae bacterium]